MLAVLEQLVDGEWHPVAFESRKLAVLELHYTPACLELLAVVLAFKALLLWLLDSEFELRATRVDSPEEGSLVAACALARRAGGVQVHSRAHPGQA